MGGFGSGRQCGRPLADHSFRVDLNWMLRTGHARPGARMSGTLRWSRGGEHAGSISYVADLEDEQPHLVLTYRRGSGASAEQVEQRIRLCRTRPHYGGFRWWMICPYRGVRAAKLYLPPHGDRFASRTAWRLGYHSQRIADHDRPFEALFRLQKRLGGPQGWEAGLARRPKGMWNRTYARMWREYEALDGQCAVVMHGMLSRLAR